MIRIIIIINKIVIALKRTLSKIKVMINPSLSNNLVSSQVVKTTR